MCAGSSSLFNQIISKREKLSIWGKHIYCKSYSSHPHGKSHSFIFQTECWNHPVKACSWMLSVQLNAAKKIRNVITITLLLFQLLILEEIISERESSRQSFEVFLYLHSSTLSPVENINHKIIYESFDIISRHPFRTRFPISDILLPFVQWRI